MTVQSNEAVVQRFFASVRAGPEAIRAVLTDDVIAEIPRSLIPYPVKGSEAVAHLYSNAITLVDPSSESQMGNWVSSGDLVYHTFELQGKVASTGKTYVQSYIFMFKVRDAKICYVRECTDSKYAWDVFGGESFAKTLQSFAKQS